MFHNAKSTIEKGRGKRQVTNGRTRNKIEDKREDKKEKTNKRQTHE